MLPDGSGRSHLLAGFAPLLVLELLVIWVTQQVIGFGHRGAFASVLTTALVIESLPALYSAFAERERKLMTLRTDPPPRLP